MQAALQAVLGTLLEHVPADLAAQERLLDALVSALCLQLVRVQAQIAASAPVGRLPDDVLAQVFGHACRHPTAPFAATSATAAAIAGTCRRWRTLAIGQPALWTRVDLRHPSAPHALKYSRRLGLYVRLDAPLWKDARDTPLARTLAPHVQRLRQLWIQTAATHTESFLHAIAAPTQLERLVITGRYTDEHPVSLPAPLLGRLRHIALTHAHITPTPTPTNLLTLALKPPPGTPPIALETLAALLRASPNLVELSLFGGAVPVYKPGEPQPPPDARADLARLRTLRIAGVNPVQAAWILFHLSYPASTHLFLDLETSRPLRTLEHDKPRPPGELESYYAVLTMFRNGAIAPLDTIALHPAPTDSLTEKLSATYSTNDATLGLVAGSRATELVCRLVAAPVGVNKLVVGVGLGVEQIEGTRGDGLESVRALEIRTGSFKKIGSVPTTPAQTSPKFTVNVNGINGHSTNINGHATPNVNGVHTTANTQPTPTTTSFPLWTPFTTTSTLMTPFIPGATLATPRPPLLDANGQIIAGSGSPMLSPGGMPNISGSGLNPNANGVNGGASGSNANVNGAPGPNVNANGAPGSNANMNGTPGLNINTTPNGDQGISPVTSESTTAIAEPEPTPEGPGSVHSASADTTLASAGTDSDSDSEPDEAQDGQGEEEEQEEDTDSNEADGGSTLDDFSDSELEGRGRGRKLRVTGRPGTPGPGRSKVAGSTVGTVGGSNSGANTPLVETPSAQVKPLPNPIVQNLRANTSNGHDFTVRSQSANAGPANPPPPVPKRSATTPYGFASYATAPAGFGTPDPVRPPTAHHSSLPSFHTLRTNQVSYTDDPDIRLLSALSFHMPSLEELKIVRSSIRGGALVKFIEARNNLDEDSSDDSDPGVGTWGVRAGPGTPVLMLELVECPYVSAEHVRVLRESVDDVRWRPFAGGI